MVLGQNMKHKKPEYLYHGSQYLLDIIKPQIAKGNCKLESMTAIYAAETIKEVIPFALPIRWYPDTPDGKRVFQCNKGITELAYGSIDPNGIGYVYKVKSDSFKKIDEWQWISESEIIPEEVIKIKVSDYIDTIIFSDEAKVINKSLYKT